MVFKLKIPVISSAPEVALVRKMRKAWLQTSLPSSLALCSKLSQENGEAEVSPSEDTRFLKLSALLEYAQKEGGTSLSSSASIYSQICFSLQTETVHPRTGRACLPGVPEHRSIRTQRQQCSTRFGMQLNGFKEIERLTGGATSKDRFMDRARKVHRQLDGEMERDG